MEAHQGSKNVEPDYMCGSPKESWEGKGMMVEIVSLHPYSWRKHYKENHPVGEGRSESPSLLLKVAPLEMGQDLSRCQSGKGSSY